jgi:hypothetical protein
MKSADNLFDKNRVLVVGHIVDSIFFLRYLA